jgi:hypothetical protein
MDENRVPVVAYVDRCHSSKLPIASHTLRLCLNSLRDRWFAKEKAPKMVSFSNFLRSHNRYSFHIQRAGTSPDQNKVL